MDMTTAITATTTTEPVPVSGIDAAELLAPWLESPEHAWSIGIYGAIGEFMHDADEATHFTRGRHALSAQTARGGLFLDLPGQVHLQALRYDSQCSSGGQMQRVDVLLPAAAAAMPVNHVLTELPADEGVGEAGTVEFDLGLGSPWVRFCVRSDDEPLTARLRAAAGRGVFDEGNLVLHDLHAASPVRLLRSAVGTLEVYGAIPTRGERSPEAPHTHLLPRLLKRNEALDTAAYVPVLSLYPANPRFDKYGQPRDFDAGAAAAFEHLYRAYGAPAVA